MLKRFWNWLLGKTTLDEQIEEKVDNAKRTIVATKKKVVKRVEEVKEEIAEAREAIEDAIEQVKAVEAAQGDLIEGKVTKSKLRMLKKQDLLDHAKREFSADLDAKLSKTNLVNKVYELHHKK